VSAQEFGFPPLGKFAQLFPVAIGLGLPVILIGAILALNKDNLVWLAVLPTLVFLPVAAAIMAKSMHRRRVRLDAGMLHYGFTPWRRIAVTALDLAASRIVNLDEQRDLQPVLRLAGTAMPGYRSGWFWLRNGKPAYVVLMDRRRVLLLAKRNGGMILLGVEKPDALLDALRRTADDKAGSAR
jgi:heme exporter protein D